MVTDKKIKLSCPVCNKEYWAYKKSVEQGASKTCSRVCGGHLASKRYKATRVHLLCQFCGEAFDVSPCYSKQMFCSNKCMGLSRRSSLLDKPINAEYAERRKTRKAENGGHFTKSEFRDLCAAFGNRCLCCGTTTEPLAADHVIPLVQGGRNDITNIQPLCKRCNSMKSGKYIDYRREILRMRKKD